MKLIGISIAVFIAGLLAGILFCSAPFGTADARKTIRIAILTPLNHPSLDEAVRGFKSRLAVSELRDAHVEYVLYNAQGELSKLPSLIGEIIASKPTIVFSLTTPATVQAVKHIPTLGIPLVFTAVTDPVGAGILKNLNGSELPITGVADKFPVSDQMNFLKVLLPSVKSVGICRNPAEQNSKVISEESQKELNGLGISSTFVDIDSEAQIPAKIRDALAKYDCLMVNGDNLLTANIGKLINLCSAARKPLYVGDTDSVKNGALAAVGPSYFSLGRQAGTQAVSIIQGKKPGTIPCEFPATFDYIINTVAAETMGVKIDQTALRSRTLWRSRSGE